MANFTTTTPFESVNYQAMLLGKRVLDIIEDPVGVHIHCKSCKKGRWPNTVFARASADAVQRAHKDCKNKHVVNRAIILFLQNLHYLRCFSLLLNAVY